jgi:hypothetical protein
MADQQGTGKHPHKSAEDPRPHHEAQESHSGGGHQGGSHSGSGKQQQQEHSSTRQQGGSESSDLKEREYRDKDGNVHHHTHTSSHQGEK